MWIYEPPSDWAYYEFETPTYYTTDRELPNLDVFNDRGLYQSDGDYKMVGIIRNDHGSRVEFVEAISTLYNAEGTVVGCRGAYANSSYLNPNQTSSFKVNFSSRDYNDVASYKLQFDGYPQSSTPPLDPPDILSNHSSFVSSADYLHVVGEVQNNTAHHLKSVTVIANFFDSAGRLIDNETDSINLNNLPTGEKTCFDILLEEPSGWSYYEFEIPVYETGGDTFPNLTIFNDSGSYDPATGWYGIMGQVRNDHGTRIEYVCFYWILWV
jgi:hypothetical protein